MNLKRLFLAWVFIFAAIPNVLAHNSYTNEDETSSPSNYSVNTTYEAGTYIPPIEVYNIDLEWDDLHWIFIYSGNITNPTSKVWMTKAEYDSYRNGKDSNEFNLIVLNNINQFKDHDVAQINITNHSVFDVNISATIEDKVNANYTNSAVLQVATENNSNWNNQSTINNLSNNSSSYFKIKPQSARFVNDSGTTVNVLGEVKLTFTKS